MESRVNSRIRLCRSLDVDFDETLNTLHLYMVYQMMEARLITMLYELGFNISIA